VIGALRILGSFTALRLFPETILRSIGYGGIATVVVDMLAALTVLPALLAVLGPKRTEHLRRAA